MLTPRDGLPTSVGSITGMRAPVNINYVERTQRGDRVNKFQASVFSGKVGIALIGGFILIIAAAFVIYKKFFGKKASPAPKNQRKQGDGMKKRIISSVLAIVRNTMKKLKHFLAMVALVLTVCIFISSEPCQIVSAVVGTDIKLSKLYLKEVKMFYGMTEEIARSACESEGYIFCPTNLNEGAPKTVIINEESFSPDSPMGIYMGYKTTDNPKNAITDMILPDVKYTNFEKVDYEKFLNDHVEDFRNEAGQMMTLVRELDMKYNAGSPNAIMAYDLLNKFYDGDPKGEYAVNDTGKPLGDLLLNKTKTEIGDKAYNSLSAEQKSNTADLQQIILESSGPAVLIIEQSLALATDTADDTWLDRLDGLTGDEPPFSALRGLFKKTRRRVVKRA